MTSQERKIERIFARTLGIRNPWAAMEKIRQRCEVKEIPIATWEVVAEKAARAAAKGPIQKPFPFLLAVTRRTLVAILMKRQEDESKARAARDRRARRTSDARVDELVRRAIFGATKPA